MKQTTYILLPILIAAVCISCLKNKEPEVYVLESKTIEVYENQYNDKGKLEKVIKHNYVEHYTNEGNFGDHYTEEYLYFYDQRDSLTQVKGFLADREGEKEISSQYFYTDSTTTEIGYSSYPADTMRYSYSKLNARKQPIEIVDKTNLRIPGGGMDISRRRIIHQYDEKGNLTTSRHINLMDNTESVSHFERKGTTLNDTTFVDTHDKAGKLMDKSKRFAVDGMMVEVTQTPEYNGVDSVSYKNGKEIKSVSLYDGERTETLTEYDQHGNVTRKEIKTYRTKEAKERRDKEIEEMMKDITSNPSMNGK